MNIPGEKWFTLPHSSQGYKNSYRYYKYFVLYTQYHIDIATIDLYPFLKALVKERMEDWKVKIGQKLNKTMVELTGDVAPDQKAITSADIIITTPEKWDGISRSWQTRKYVRAVRLIIIDEIHMLGEDRGPVLEVIVSRTNFISGSL